MFFFGFTPPTAPLCSTRLRYVYRQHAWDRPSDWFSEIWDQYLTDRKLVPQQEIFGITPKTVGFYTNFFIGSVEFFTSPEVDRILTHVFCFRALALAFF